MAQHVDSNGIKALSVVSYDKIRGKLKTGDLFFASGDYLVSKLIQHATDSPWSHVGIIVKIDAIDRILLLESVEDMGVRIAPLSKYLHDYEGGKPYKGRIVTARHKELTASVVTEISSFGMDELTQPYDKAEITNILARISLGIGRKKNARNREYICSELVYECFSHAGKTLNVNPKGFVSPQDLWLDEKVSLMDRIL